MSKNNKTKHLVTHIILWGTFLFSININAQDTGYIWLKSFKPGSAELTDPSIDRDVLTFIDSLVKRNDIEIQFLGATDQLKWKQSGEVKEISTAWDEAKKLERASALRERYGLGEIGTTDEPVRGVKIVWSPRRPDIFSMKKQINELETLTDSLRAALDRARSQQVVEIKALEDSITNRDPDISMTSFAEITNSTFDWEFKSGLFFWSAGNPYDLAAPYVGLVLKRQMWAVELQGGLSPWTKASSAGKVSDAFLMGTINLCSDYFFDLKIGMITGWEFLTNSDNWTMKVMGLTAGPNIHYRFLNTYIGYNLGKLSTLTNNDEWVHSIVVTMNFKVKIN